MRKIVHRGVGGRTVTIAKKVDAERRYLRGRLSVADVGRA